MRSPQWTVGCIISAVRATRAMRGYPVPAWLCIGALYGFRSVPVFRAGVLLYAVPRRGRGTTDERRSARAEPSLFLLCVTLMRQRSPYGWYLVRRTSGNFLTARSDQRQTEGLMGRSWTWPASCSVTASRSNPAIKPRQAVECATAEQDTCVCTTVVPVAPCSSMRAIYSRPVMMRPPEDQHDRQEHFDAYDAGVINLGPEGTRCHALRLREVAHITTSVHTSLPRML